MSVGLPKLYSELAPWWPLLSHPEDYDAEAGVYSRLLLEKAGRSVREVLELGSGGGNNAYWMKSRFALTLVDVSPQMLAVSRALNPGVEHLLGDMRSLRLGRRFDAVFIHDAVSYMAAREELSAVARTAAMHCQTGGVVLLCPDYTRESFTPGTEHGGHDAEDGRGLRYLEWAWDPDPGDDSYLVDYAYLLRDADGSTRVVHDRHTEGLFSEGVWMATLTEAGLEPEAVILEDEMFARAAGRVFVGRKPAAAPEDVITRREEQ